MYADDVVLSSDTSRRAQEIAKAVIVNYGESSGPPTIATKDAVDKNALIPGIKITLESGDAQSIARPFFATFD